MPLPSKPKSKNVGEANGRAKLNIFFVRDIKRMLADGYSQKAIAREMRVSQALVSKIHTGKLWKK